MCPRTCWPVLGSHAHQPLAVTAGFLRAERGAPVEVADVGHEFTPLAGQQVHNVHALAGALEPGGRRGQEMDVSVGGDPAPLAPVERLGQSDLDRSAASGCCNSLTNRTDLESSGDFQVRAALGHIDDGLTGDIGSPVPAAVLKLRSVVLKPSAVRQPVAVRRRQVLAGIPVQVQLGGNRLAARSVNHANSDPPRGGHHPRQRTRRTGLFEFRDGGAGSVGEVELGIRMRHVLDQDFMLCDRGQLVVIGALPVVIRIDQAGLGRDHLAQVEGDLGSAPLPVDPVIEGHVVRNFQDGLAACTPSQRMRARLPRRDGRNDQPARFRFEPQRGYRLLRMRVLPGPEPVGPR